jgi:hypothetical protein
MNILGDVIIALMAVVAVCGIIYIYLAIAQALI